MTILSKRDLLKQSVYFGRKPIKNSSQSITMVQGLGLQNYGSGLYTYGTFPSGSGLTPYGGMLYGSHITPIVGQSISSVLKKGWELLKPHAKKIGQTLLGVATNQLNKQADKIENPLLKKVAQQGISTGEKLVNNAIDGNKQLSSYTNILKSGAKDAYNSNKEEGMKQLGSLLDKGVGKVLGNGMKSRKRAPPRKKGGASYGQTNIEPSANPMVKNTNRLAQSNIQLSMLRDMVMSKKL